MDIPRDAAELVIKFTRPKVCATPKYAETEITSMLAYYNNLLVQIEWWLEMTLLTHQYPRIPTLYDEDWIQPSWWWCQTSGSLRRLIKMRYNHDHDPDDSEDRAENSPEIGMARLDPFFAPW